MSAHTVAVFETFIDGDPDVTLTPASGDSWWFTEFYQTGDDDQVEIQYEVNQVSPARIYARYDVGDQGFGGVGIDGDVNHPHILSSNQESDTGGYEIRHVAASVVPDGTQLVLSEQIVNVNDQAIVFGIAAIIDSTDEVASVLLLEDGDPDTILVPNTDFMIRWQKIAVGATDNAGGVKLILQTITGVRTINDRTIVPSATQNFEMVIEDVGDGSCFAIMKGQQLTVQESVGAGGGAFFAAIGREYSTV